ncbi:hypothetical protein EON83_04195 [bacterium]|nr:MAG: hypothetical protein EON83_04195 [bacterium]
MRFSFLASSFLSSLLLFNTIGSSQAKDAVNAPTVEAAAKATSPDISLPNGVLSDSTRWQMLEGADGNGKATLRPGQGPSVIVKGALATPLAVGDLQRSNLNGTLRFRVPAECPDWTSVAMTFYGSNNARTYAMVIFKRPDAPIGQGEILVEGSTRKACTLTPNTWYTMAVKQAQKTLSVKIWPDGTPEPTQWALQVSVSNPQVERVGVRTYGGEVEVAGLKMSGQRGQAPVLDRSLFPTPIFDREPGYVELYWKACEQAFAHVLEQPGLPQPRYMDEALWDDTIWIWDTCFMALYSRYAPRALPGIESLQNFYEPMHDGVRLHLADSPTSIIVQHPDNPPLFAWVEWQSYQMSGDKARLRWLLKDKKFLQKNYDWFNTIHRGQTFPWARAGVALSPQPLGFQWNGVASGMDNSPRFAGKDVLAIDALAQQGLNAKCIMLMAAAIGDSQIQKQFQAEYSRIRDLINTHYWDEVDGFYYDLMPDGKTFSRVRTPASFWPILAGMATPQQIERMAAHVRDPKDLGGIVPWVTVSRSDPAFNAANGNYWNGAMWLPTAYMGIRALTENGHGELADQTAEAVLRHMYLTYRDYSPHTIWECYNPSKPEPAYHGSNLVTPNFCGWSALGPISLFIENVIGFQSIDAQKNVVQWRLHQTGRHGIRDLRFGKIITDIIADGQNHINVVSTGAFTLVVNGKNFRVKQGKNVFSLT